MRYSIIVPVFNRPDEVDELLESLTHQTEKDFEVVIVEDGSQTPCEEVCKRYEHLMDIHYYYKENSGPGQSRNYGAERAVSSRQAAVAVCSLKHGYGISAAPTSASSGDRSITVASPASTFIRNIPRVSSSCISCRWSSPWA